MALLIHDAGLAAVSVEGGTNAIYSSSEFQDIEASLSSLSEPSHRRAAALFTYLREHHAKIASTLLTRTWKNPVNQQDIFLLEDAGLRSAYGETIGRIAESHHWPPSDLTAKLRSVVGAAPDLPNEWQLNEVKIALLLRCADAAHIDGRRAPLFQYALRQPKGLSDNHWRFQNKLNRPAVHDDALVYSSGSAFSPEEKDAWWLLYDTLAMVNSELMTADAILRDLTKQSGFAVKRVLGANNPKILKEHVPTEGWEPIQAEVHVSSPTYLAEMFGGDKLYGTSPLPPIRELLQNSVDAVRARRLLEAFPPQWGEITISIEPYHAESIQLVIDDNGVGMSEAVMTGTLLDFGSSLWRSEFTRKEFPKLLNSGFKSIGRFGIGFFSVFSLGKDVRIISSRFDADERPNVLKFDGISNRPLFRKASPKERPSGVSTRIRVIVPHSRFKTSGELSYLEQLGKDLRRLVSCVDVKINFNDHVTATTFTHLPDWESCSATTFLDELLPDSEFKEQTIEISAPYVRLIKNEKGETIGRAAFDFTPRRVPSRSMIRRGNGAMAVGGGVVVENIEEYLFRSSPTYTAKTPRPLPSYVGVFIGTPDALARDRSTVIANTEEILKWLNEQVKLCDLSKINIDHGMRLAAEIVSLGGYPRELPFIYLSGGYVTYEKFKSYLSTSDSLWLPLRKDYDDSLRMISAKDLGRDYFLYRQNAREELCVPLLTGYADEVAPKEYTRGRLTPEEIIPVVTHNIRNVCGNIARIIDQIWTNWEITDICMEDIFETDFIVKPERRLVLKLRRMV